MRLAWTVKTQRKVKQWRLQLQILLLLLAAARTKCLCGVMVTVSPIDCGLEIRKTNADYFSPVDEPDDVGVDLSGDDSDKENRPPSPASFMPQLSRALGSSEALIHSLRNKVCPECKGKIFFKNVELT